MKKQLILSFTIFFLVFLAIAFFIYDNKSISEQEIKIITQIQPSLSSIDRNIPKSITYLGHGNYGVWATAISAIILLLCKKLKACSIYIIAILTSPYIYSFIKNIIQRERPPIEFRLANAWGYSFPSGHSTMSMVTYGLLIYFVCKYVKNKTLKITLIAFLSLLILAIGFTRIWLGVHFPTDVIGGFSLGICIICMFAFINEIRIKD